MCCLLLLYFPGKPDGQAHPQHQNYAYQQPGQKVTQGVGDNAIIHQPQPIGYAQGTQHFMLEPVAILENVHLFWLK